MIEHLRAGERKDELPDRPSLRERERLALGVDCGDVDCLGLQLPDDSLARERPLDIPATDTSAVVRPEILEELGAEVEPSALAIENVPCVVAE